MFFQLIVSMALLLIGISLFLIGRHMRKNSLQISLQTGASAFFSSRVCDCSKLDAFIQNFIRLVRDGSW